MGYQRTHDLFGSTFGGEIMRQYWADLALWELFLNAHTSIQTVIELGSYYGGMSLFLKAQTLCRSQRFYTLDRMVPTALNTRFAAIVGLEKDFIHGDFMQERKDTLIGILAQPSIHPVLLFVDGGNKSLEFATFVPYLVLDDYVAVHDYSTEFKEEDAEPVAHLLEREFWLQCLAPPQPSLTRFWRRI